MRSGLALLLLCAVARAAAPGALETGAGWEVTPPPPSPLPIRGPRFAPVTIELWVTFGAPASQAAAGLARRAVEHPLNRDVRVLLHLTEQGPPGAELAAEAALEAAAEGRSFEFLDRALADRALELTAADLVRAGREAGLDGDRLAEALDTRRHRAAAAELDREARAQGHVAGQVLINGVAVQPYLSDELMLAAIADGRRRAQVLLDEGVPLGRLYERLIELTAEAHAPSEPGPRKRLAIELAGAPSRGPSLAPVTVVVFSNFLCAGCGQAAQLVKRLREAHPGRVREVWKNFAASYSLYGLEPFAAELAVSAAAQGRFWELHELAFSSPARARMLRADLERLGRGAGLDLERALRESRHDQLRPLVERDLAEAHKLGVQHAPALVVNGILYSALPTWERLERQVRQELARGLLDRLQSP